MEQSFTAKKRSDGRNEDSNMEYKKLHDSNGQKRENSTHSQHYSQNETGSCSDKGNDI